MWHLFLLVLGTAIEFPSMPIPVDWASVDASVSLPGKQSLIVGTVCDDYLSNSSDNICQLSDASNRIAAVVLDTSRVPPTILHTSFLDSVAIDDFPRILFAFVRETPTEGNPYVYLVHQQVIMQYKLFPNSSLLSPSEISVHDGSERKIDSLFGTYDPVGLQVFLVGNTGPNVSIASLDLEHSRVEYTDLFTMPISLPNSTSFSSGVLLFDHDLKRQVVAMYDVYLVDVHEHRVVSSLIYNGQFSGGAIDALNQKVYLLNQAEGALKRFNYSEETLFEETSFSGNFFHSRVVIHVPLLRVLHVWSDDDVEVLQVIDISQDAFSIVLAYTSVTGSASKQQGTLLTGSLVTGEGSILVVQARGLNESEVLVIELEVCRPLQSNNTPGCINCPRGTFFQSGFCSNCANGRYSPISGVTSCMACSVNSLNQHEGLYACQVCGARSELFNGTCECLAGFTLMSDVCASCQEMTYKPVSGNQQCDICPIDSVSTDGNRSCSCLPSFYRLDMNGKINRCVTCPAEGICDGSPNVKNKPGYWRWKKNDTRFMECPSSSACQAEDSCAQGTTGILCGECSPGYAVSSSLQGCVQCDGPNAGVWTVFCIFIVLVVWRLFRGDGKMQDYVILAILISHLQILAELAVLRPNADSNSAVVGLFEFLRVFQLQFLSYSSAVCTVPGPFSSQWLVQIFVTIIILAVAFLGALIKLFFVSKEVVFKTVLRVSLTILKFCLISNIKLSLVVLFCLGTDSRGQQYFDSDGKPIAIFSNYPSLGCFQGEHLTLTFLAIVFMMFYDFSTLGIMAVLLFRKTEVDITFLIGPYTPECRYWEIVALLRRALVAVLSSSFRYLGRNWAIGLVLFFSLILSMTKQPYASKEAGKMDLLSLHVLHLTYLIGVLLQAGLTEDTSAVVIIILLNSAFVAVALFLFFRTTIQRVREKMSQKKQLDASSELA